MEDDAAPGIGTAPVERRSSLPSTNEELLDRARSGDTGPIWLRTDEQTGGRGRLGRVWSSPVGNLYISLLLTAPSELRYAPQLAIVAAVALVDAIHAVAGPFDGLALKWPNDLLIGGAKVSGILVEGTTGADGRPACVIGWGVNCRSCPTGLPYSATHLSAAAGRPISADEIERGLRKAMAARLCEWDRAAGFGRIMAAWLRAGPSLGTALTVTSGGTATEGFFEGLDEGGRLRLRTSAGMRVFEAGEVSLRHPSAGRTG